jgi:hypothetical protein
MRIFYALGIVLTRLGDITLESDLEKKSIEMSEVPKIMMSAGMSISRNTLFLFVYMSSLFLMTDAKVSHTELADLD